MRTDFRLAPSPGAARRPLPRRGEVSLANFLADFLANLSSFVALRLPVVVAPLVMAMLGGCDPHQDPIDKPGTWSLPPAGLTSNDENLRTMLVNPNDLVAGTGTNTSAGSEAAAPVRRLIAGQRAKLPSSEGSLIPSSDTSQPGGAGLGAGSAGPIQ